METIKKQLDGDFTLEFFERNEAFYKCLDYLPTHQRIAGKLALDTKQILVGSFSVKRITNRRKYNDELVFTIRNPKSNRSGKLWEEPRNDSKYDYVEIYFPFVHAERMLSHIFKELVYS